MNLDKNIRISLMMLSKKYKITIIEITVANEGRVSKTYKVTYEERENNNVEPKREEFKNKRELVRWLMCLQ